MQTIRIVPPDFNDDNAAHHTFIPWDNILAQAHKDNPGIPGQPIGLIAGHGGVRVLWAKKPQATRYVCKCDRTHDITTNVTACDCGLRIYAQQNSKGIWYVTSTERPRFKD
jgi:hypothetical protein